MERQTTGTVVSVKKQWWLKVNSKPVRTHAMDGATFPHIMKISYTVNGREYFKRKWIGVGKPCPSVGTTIIVSYQEENPKKCRIE